MTHSFLGVEKSLGGARWLAPTGDDHHVTRMMQTQGLPEIVARLLVNRNVRPEEADMFLNPALKHLPDPLVLKDMEGAAALLADAIITKKAVGIFGDFDVDGATSSAILHRFFRQFGLIAPITIPDRLQEGYGPNIGAFARMKQDGIQIAVITDCGVTSHDIMKAARDMGLELIILDHHEPEKEKPLPEAHFIIDPKRADDKSGLDDLCAAGLSWMACYATGKELLRRGFVSDKKELGLSALLDLVALGTTCDMVPLRGINRILMDAGMRALQLRSTPGIQALCQVGKIPEGKPITTFHLGFAFGPRINAGSRMLDSSLGARLLSTDNPREALEIAQVLDELNERRKLLSKELQQHALENLKSNSNYDPRVIIATLPEADGDVKGLVATDLCQRFDRPALALMPKTGEKGEMLLTGSARSVKGFDIASMMFAARDQGLLLKGGGHAMAGGCTLEERRLPEFMEWLPSYLDSVAAPQEFTKELDIDGLMTAQGATVSAAKLLTRVGPYGQGNKPPRFAMAEVQIYEAKPVGDGSHISCRVSDKEGGASIKAIAFRATEKPLGAALLTSAKDQTSLHLAGELDINEWQGRESAQLKIEDGALA
ncbi:MAG: single-stranded-DNA-specific exonuclease RecJ [Rhodospirillales bacterium]|nr:single-stranded-DNA-specific exonuclease RecJ [Rhodospirillales bacterium]